MIISMWALMSHAARVEMPHELGSGTGELSMCFVTTDFNDGVELQ